MATSLRSRLNDLASAFASGVLAAIRDVSLEELLVESTAGGGRAPSAARAAAAARPAARGRAASAAAAPARPARKSGRLARRSDEDIAGVIERIVGLLRQSPRGLRAEQIRARLGLQAKEMPRPLKEGLAAGRLAKSGQKRSTTYFAKGAGAPAKAEPAAAGKPAKKAARRGRRPKAAAAVAPKRARARAGRGARGGKRSKRAAAAGKGRAAKKAAAPSAAAS